MSGDWGVHGLMSARRIDIIEGVLVCHGVASLSLSLSLFPSLPLPSLLTQHPSLNGHHKTVNFHDIVDEDERSLEHRFSHVFVGWLIESLPFRMTLLVAILLDSLTIGIQTDRHLVRGLLITIY